MASKWTLVVEHLDPELGPWSALEYESIAKEANAANMDFTLSGVDQSLQLPGPLVRASGFQADQRATEEIFPLNSMSVCLLDPKADTDLAPQDGELFEIFLFGGILGDDPPRDRTSELRSKGYQRRRLGPVQMTTDTAARVTRMVVQEKTPLDQIPYIDYPELKIDEHESASMPFRFVKAGDGQPIMPEGMVELIKKDSEKDFGDLL